MAIIRKPAIVFPEHVISQQAFLDTLREHYRGIDQLDLSLRLASHTSVQQRHFVTPLAKIHQHQGVAQRMQDYIRSGLPLACRAIQQALINADLTPREIHHFIFISCTIPAVMLPGLDAHIVNALDFLPSIRRLPIAQMGCHGGATGLAQAHQYLLAYPQRNVLVCAMELCSLNEQPEDVDPSSFVSRGLFGDGCAAVVVQGNDHDTGLSVLETEQFIVRRTLPNISYKNDHLGSHFATNREVLEGVVEGLGFVRSFLSDHGYRPRDLEVLVAHTGGPKVLRTTARELGVDEQLIMASYESLREVGNLSSVSVLDVLHRTFERYRPQDGAIGLLLAYGPGTTTEMALVRWQEGEHGARSKKRSAPVMLESVS